VSDATTGSPRVGLATCTSGAAAIAAGLDTRSGTALAGASRTSLLIRSSDCVRPAEAKAAIAMAVARTAMESRERFV